MVRLHLAYGSCHCPSDVVDCGHHLARNIMEAELNAARITIEEQRTGLAAAEVELAAARDRLTVVEHERAGAVADFEAARQAAAALQAELQAMPANVQHGGPPPDEGLPEIPRPPGAGWSIRNSMDLGVEDYAEIQVSVCIML